MTNNPQEPYTLSKKIWPLQTLYSEVKLYT